MAATKGNQFWKARATHGRKKIFATPDAMFDAACEYFQWCEDHPLKKDVFYQGIKAAEESLMRAMTISGLCIFLGVHNEYLNGFESDLDLDTAQGKDFSQVISRIKQIIRTQKFEGASAGLLNANIIARDLGLADKQETTSIELTHEQWLESLE